MNWLVTIGSKTKTVNLPDQLPSGSSWEVNHEGKIYQVSMDREGSHITITNPKNEKRSFEIKHSGVNRSPDEPQVSVNIGYRHVNSLHRFEAQATLNAPGMDSIQARMQKAGAVVKSPMAGKILKILEKNGSLVSKGQTIAIVEAMKMENRIQAPTNGKLKLSSIEEGSQVAPGQTLFEIESL